MLQRASSGGPRTGSQYSVFGEVRCSTDTAARSRSWSWTVLLQSDSPVGWVSPPNARCSDGLPPSPTLPPSLSFSSLLLSGTSLPERSAPTSGSRWVLAAGLMTACPDVRCAGAARRWTDVARSEASVVPGDGASVPARICVGGTCPAITSKERPRGHRRTSSRSWPVDAGGRGRCRRAAVGRATGRCAPGSERRTHSLVDLLSSLRRGLVSESRRRRRPGVFHVEHVEGA